MSQKVVRIYVGRGEKAEKCLEKFNSLYQRSGLKTIQEFLEWITPVVENYSVWPPPRKECITEIVSAEPPVESNVVECTKLPVKESIEDLNPKLPTIMRIAGGDCNKSLAKVSRLGDKCTKPPVKISIFDGVKHPVKVSIVGSESRSKSKAKSSIRTPSSSTFGTAEKKIILVSSRDQLKFPMTKQVEIVSQSTSSSHINIQKVHKVTYRDTLKQADIPGPSEIPSPPGERYKCNETSFIEHLITCEERPSEASHIENTKSPKKNSMKREKKYRCDICNKIFSQKSSAQQHLRIHTGEKPYKCEICGKGFKWLGYFRIHERTHTGEKPFKCHICEKHFAQKDTLKKHRLIHTGEKPYKCDVCGKGFAWRGYLYTHRRIHTGEKPYECDICGKSFNVKGLLRRHFRMHTGEKPYECDICGKRFTEKQNLHTHLRIHTGEKPYKCNVCEKTFARKAPLQRHLRIHTGEKPYKCDICGRGFNQNGHLKYHLGTHK